MPAASSAAAIPSSRRRLRRSPARRWRQRWRRRRRARDEAKAGGSNTTRRVHCALVPFVGPADRALAGWLIRRRAEPTSEAAKNATAAVEGSAELRLHTPVATTTAASTAIAASTATATSIGTAAAAFGTTATASIAPASDTAAFATGRRTVVCAALRNRIGGTVMPRAKGNIAASSARSSGLGVATGRRC